MLIVGAGMFGIFLFLTYYLQQTLRYSPVVTGVAFLPMVGMIVVSASLSNIILMPRLGPKPVVAFGMLLAALSMAWLTRIGLHSGYAAVVLGPLLLAGTGFGFTIAPGRRRHLRNAAAPRPGRMSTAARRYQPPFLTVASSPARTRPVAGNCLAGPYSPARRAGSASRGPTCQCGRCPGGVDRSSADAV
jgi:hypothetical protein